jgi:CHASE2 domain-containing sensor protein
MLNYRSPKNAVKQVSVSEVLDGKIDASLIKDRVVLIGYTTPIAKDDFYTPYSAGLQDSQKMPGVVIHAQHVSQILSTVLNNRPLMWCWSEAPEILWILGWSVVGGLLAWRIRRLWLFGLGVVIGVGVLYGTAYVLFLNSGWVPLSTTYNRVGGNGNYSCFNRERIRESDLSGSEKTRPEYRN